MISILFVFILFNKIMLETYSFLKEKIITYNLIVEEDK